jgi:hypothetical protein
LIIKNKKEVKTLMATVMKSKMLTGDVNNMTGMQTALETEIASIGHANIVHICSACYRDTIYHTIFYTEAAGG